MARFKFVLNIVFLSPFLTLILLILILLILILFTLILLTLILLTLNCLLRRFGVGK